MVSTFHGLKKTTNQNSRILCRLLTDALMAPSTGYLKVKAVLDKGDGTAQIPILDSSRSSLGVLTGHKSATGGSTDFTWLSQHPR